tara:strand:+ start:1133 stop:1396 length:264 start_codon:yes stop_codon:yes gene_type:complete
MNRRRAMTGDIPSRDTASTERGRKKKERENKKKSALDMSTRAWIVGVDASPASVRAVRWFADTIGRAGDRARLVHVIPGCDAMRCDL